MSDKEFLEIIEDVLYTNIDEIKNIDIINNIIILQLQNGNTYNLTVTKQAD